jgi:hypothetical protein
MGYLEVGWYEWEKKKTDWAEFVNGYFSVLFWVGSFEIRWGLAREKPYYDVLEYPSLYWVIKGS